MGSDIIQQICDYLVRRGYTVDFGNVAITATLADNPTQQIICIKKVEHDDVRLWSSFRCPPDSDKLILLETINKLNRDLTVSRIIGLIEMDCDVMIGACFPYVFEDCVFELFFDRFLEDAQLCLQEIQAVIADSDDGKTIIRM